jgi:triosephosphate isomerase (TIM)
MLSKKIILANWKMQLSYDETINLAKEIKDKLKNHKLENTNIALCADFLTIPELSRILKDTHIDLGSQNVFWKEKGAYTGEISIENLKHFNIKFVMIGHSERRQNLAESNEMINKKLKLVLKSGLIPVLCVGENLEERRKNQKDMVLMEEIKSALMGIKIKDIPELIVAYEPIWSISTTKVKQKIDIAEVEYTNKLIKQILLDNLFFENDIISIEKFEDKIRIIFGGSVDASNIANFIKQPHVHGVLVGGASLNTRSFINLINNAI